MVDPGFTKGGHKLMDACCLYDHSFNNHQNHKVVGGQN